MSQYLKAPIFDSIKLKEKEILQQFSGILFCGCPENQKNQSINISIRITQVHAYIHADVMCDLRWIVITFQFHVRPPNIKLIRHMLIIKLVKIIGIEWQKLFSV